MSIVIIGGNEKMVCIYKNLCKEYNCKPKIFTQMSGSFKNQIGSPDLMILFTSTVSHKMIFCATQNVDKTKTIITRSHSSSSCALKNILNQYCNLLQA